MRENNLLHSKRKNKITKTLESRMVLHRFMCHQFGYQTLREILDRLKYLSDQLDKNKAAILPRGY